MVLSGPVIFMAGWVAQSLILLAIIHTTWWISNSLEQLPKWGQGLRKGSDRNRRLRTLFRAIVIQSYMSDPPNKSFSLPSLYAVNLALEAE